MDKILDENTPKLNESVEISSVLNTDVLFALVIASVICGVGVWLLGSGMRSPTR